MRPRPHRPALPDRSSLVLGFGVCSLLAVVTFLFLGPIVTRLDATRCRRAVCANAATLQVGWPI